MYFFGYTTNARSVLSASCERGLNSMGEQQQAAKCFFLGAACSEAAMDICSTPGKCPRGPGAAATTTFGFLSPAPGGLLLWEGCRGWCDWCGLLARQGWADTHLLGQDGQCLCAHGRQEDRGGFLGLD